MLKGFALYIKLMLCPYPLSVEYLFPVSHSLFEPSTFASLLLLSAAAWVAWRVRKSQPLLAFGIALFFASLIPVSNIIPIRTIINERFLYLAVAGFGLAVASVVNRLDFKKAPVVLLGLLLAGYAVVTVNRNTQWSDQFTFVAANLKTCPQSARLHYAMGKSFAERSDWDKAIGEYRVAARLRKLLRWQVSTRSG